MLYISGITGWPVPEPPKIEYIESPHRMFILANGCDIRPEEPICKTFKSGNSKVLGLYNNITRTVLLNKDFWPYGTRDQSILLHELVHHMQFSTDRKYYAKLCTGLIEKEAFDIQEKWLVKWKSSLQEAIRLGPLYRYFITQCNIF